MDKINWGLLISILLQTGIVRKPMLSKLLAKSILKPHLLIREILINGTMTAHITNQLIEWLH